MIGCGGTIASVPNEHGTLVPAQTAEQLLHYIPELNEIAPNLDVLQLMSKDSSDMGPADWRQLTQTVVDQRKNYAGFIVTHGTDTMAHTATAAAFALQGLDRPVVFTGSQLPMTAKKTDAIRNLTDAIKTASVAAEEVIGEKMIVFHSKILRAARTVKTSDHLMDAFDSPNFPEIGWVLGKMVSFTPGALTDEPVGKTLPENNFNRGVVTVDLHPGISPDIIRAVTQSAKCAGVILRTFGLGGLPSLGEDSLIPVIEETVSAGKPVILTSKFIDGDMKPETYEPGKKAMDAGAGHTGNMTDVAAQVKLSWLLGQGIIDPQLINQAMLTPYVGEVDN